MATIINASNSTGLTLTSDLSGTLQFQNNGVNLPMGGVAPTFSAYANTTATTLTGGVNTQIIFDTKAFDTANCFSTSTYRFTPTVTGYYQINVGITAVFGAGESAVLLYKNGNVSRVLGDFQGPYAYTIVSSDIVYFNGSTDYITIGAFTQTTVNTIASGRTFLTGCLIRGA